MRLQTVLTFPWTLTSGIDRPLLVQKFTVTFTSQTTLDTVSVGTKLDVNAKGSGFVGRIASGSSSLEKVIWLVGFSGTRWAATDTVRNVDNSNGSVGTCDADTETDATDSIGNYVSCLNTTSAGATSNAAKLVQEVHGNSYVTPKNGVQAGDEYTVVCGRSTSGFAIYDGTGSEEVVLTVLRDE